MKEKIDWYQEVLELEPGSKVFFPLARLLAEDRQLERAVQTLRHGLDRHPEFIEARLYLIDLLFRHGQLEQCEEQIGLLSPLFSRYEGFWQAWGSSVAASGKEGDAGLALNFLAAAFQQRSLTLADVLSRGLEAVLRQEGQAAPAEKQACTAAPKGPVPSLSPASSASPVSGVAAVLSPLAGVVQSLPAEISVDAANACGADSAGCQSGDAAQGDEAQEEGEEAEERFSLRTRSMAEVLAEQGDFAAALEIYQELAAQASSPEEAADLQYRMSTLTAHLGVVQETATEPETAPSPGKHRVLSVLEALAERLENRVHG